MNRGIQKCKNIPGVLHKIWKFSPGCHYFQSIELHNLTLNGFTIGHPPIDFYEKSNLIIGIGVPVELKSSAVVLGFAFRAVYTLPSNLSQLMPMDQNTRRRRSTSRWEIYRILEDISERKGLGGRTCILRSICEAADVPLDKHNGLFEEMFQILFSPSTTKEDINHHTDNEYYAAQDLGHRKLENCWNASFWQSGNRLSQLSTSFPSFSASWYSKLFPLISFVAEGLKEKNS
ncbi:hypothetical protein NQ317_016753 [Molorchus minor]|uniref:Uncharacterized protein n=1 Tax=Molorchus minor TaxID=1323400 RepID=A0ABQ9JLM6_9CUCU|nr:hypothetical protein NQ317_016753 [Molorchus minor]